MIGRKTGGRDFLPGNKIGAKGRTPAIPEVKEVRALNHVTVPLVIDRYMKMDLEELKAVMQRPGTPAVEMIIAKVIVEAIRKGDQQRLSFLFDRLLGKQTESVRVEGGMLHLGVLKLINKINDEK